jgi:hypothetical protein
MKSNHETTSSSCFGSDDFHSADFESAPLRRDCEQYLGFHPDTDYDLEWILEDAMESNMPDGWKYGDAPDGTRNVYWNTKTGQKSDSRPWDPKYRELFEKEKAKKSQIAAPIDASYSLSSSPPAMSPFGSSTSRSIDREFERMDQEEQKLADLRAKEREAADQVNRLINKAQEKKLALDRQVRNLQVERDNLEQRKILQQQELDQLEAEHVLALSRMKLAHQEALVKVRERQKRELEGVLEETRPERGKKYQTRFQELLQEEELTKNNELVFLEGELRNVQAQYEEQLKSMKKSYGELVSHQGAKLERVKAEGKEEIRKLRGSLELKKIKVVQEFEDQIIDDKRRILKQKFQENKRKLEVQSLKSITIRGRKRKRLSLGLSLPMSLDIIDDSDDSQEQSEREATEASALNISDHDLTEIKPFSSVHVKHVQFGTSSLEVKPEKLPESFWEKGNNAMNEVDSGLNEIGETCRHIRNIAVGENEHLAVALGEFEEQQRGLNNRFQESIQELRKAHQVALGAVSQAHQQMFRWSPKPPRTPQPVRTRKIYPDVVGNRSFVGDDDGDDDEEEESSTVRRVRKFNNAVKIAKKEQAVVRREFHIARVHMEDTN